MRTETFDRILKWASVINKKPNTECKFFYLSDNEKAMIIDFSKVKGMPFLKNKVIDKDKSYLFVDLTNEKSIRYYAHDISLITNGIINEIEGEVLLNIVELDLLGFIEENIYVLSRFETPFCSFVALNKERPTSIVSDNKLTSYNHSYNRGGYNLPQNNTGAHSWNASSYNYDSSSYKIKSDFTDKLYLLVKNGKTGLASDHINKFINEKIEEKELINDILRSLSIDKLDLVSILEILKSTSLIKEGLSDRKSLLTKFKELVIKTNSKRTYSCLSEMA